MVGGSVVDPPVTFNWILNEDKVVGGAWGRRNQGVVYEFSNPDVSGLRYLQPNGDIVVFDKDPLRFVGADSTRDLTPEIQQEISTVYSNNVVPSHVIKFDPARYIDDGIIRPRVLNEGNISETKSKDVDTQIWEFPDFRTKKLVVFGEDLKSAIPKDEHNWFAKTFKSTEKYMNEATKEGGIWNLGHLPFGHKWWGDTWQFGEDLSDWAKGKATTPFARTRKNYQELQIGLKHSSAPIALGEKIQRNQVAERMRVMADYVNRGNFTSGIVNNESDARKFLQRLEQDEQGKRNVEYWKTHSPNTPQAQEIAFREYEKQQPMSVDAAIQAVREGGVSSKELADIQSKINTASDPYAKEYFTRVRDGVVSKETRDIIEREQFRKPEVHFERPENGANQTRFEQPGVNQTGFEQPGVNQTGVNQTENLRETMKDVNATFSAEPNVTGVYQQEGNMTGVTPDAAATEHPSGWAEGFSKAGKIASAVGDYALTAWTKGIWPIAKAIIWAAGEPLLMAGGTIVQDFVIDETYKFRNWAGNHMPSLAKWMNKVDDKLGEKGRAALSNIVSNSIAAIPSAIHDYFYQQNQEALYKQQLDKKKLEDTKLQEAAKRENRIIDAKYNKDHADWETAVANAKAELKEKNDAETIRIHDAERENARIEANYQQELDHYHNMQLFEEMVDDIKAGNLQNEQDVKRRLAREQITKDKWDAWTNLISSTANAISYAAPLPGKKLKIADVAKAAGTEAGAISNWAYQLFGRTYIDPAEPDYIPTAAPKKPPPKPKYESTERRKFAERVFTEPKKEDYDAQKVDEQITSGPDPVKPLEASAYPYTTAFMKQRAAEQLAEFQAIDNAKQHRIDPIALQQAINQIDEDTATVVAAENTAGTSKPLNVGRVPIQRFKSRMTVAPLQGLTAMRLNLGRIHPPSYRVVKEEEEEEMKQVKEPKKKRIRRK